MGWDCEEDQQDGQDGRPKPQRHITFEEGSLNGSDEDDGAVEVSVAFVPFSSQTMVSILRKPMG
jgi:hypothetical protein